MQSGGGALACSLTCFSRCACVLDHMECLLRQDRCPLATWVVSEKGSRVVRPQEKKCRLADFRRKRKVCGATSAAQVPTRGFSAKKEVVWRDLSAIFHHSAKKEGGWPRIFGRKGNRVARPLYQHRLNDP